MEFHDAPLAYQVSTPLKTVQLACLVLLVRFRLLKQLRVLFVDQDQIQDQQLQVVKGSF